MSEPSMHCISNKHFNFTWSGFEVGNVSRQPSKLLTNQSGSKVAPSRYDQTHQPKMNIFCTLIPPQFPSLVLKMAPGVEERWSLIGAAASETRSPSEFVRQSKTEGSAAKLCGRRGDPSALRRRLRQSYSPSEHTPSWWFTPPSRKVLTNLSVLTIHGPRRTNLNFTAWIIYMADFILRRRAIIRYTYCIFSSIMHVIVHPGWQHTGNKQWKRLKEAWRRIIARHTNDYTSFCHIFLIRRLHDLSIYLLGASHCSKCKNRGNSVQQRCLNPQKFAQLFQFK